MRRANPSGLIDTLPLEHERTGGRNLLLTQGLEITPLQFTQSKRAFSLIEVVVAVGIFAVGMVAIVGLFTPVARWVSSSSDADAATRVADALRTKLQAMPFGEVIALLKNTTGSGHEVSAADARGDYNPAADPQIVFASRDGSKVGVYADSVWNDPATEQNTDREKFFEIALIRNDALSPRPIATEPVEGETPVDPDATAFVLAYIARVRWPAFVNVGGAGAVQVGSNPSGTVRFDHSSKQVMFFTGAVTR
jgi:uncharacterized protein (TIGR02598 family)